MNLFQYTNNNSVNYVDPQGEFLVPILLGAASGAAIDLATQFLANAVTGCDSINWESVGQSALLGSAGVGAVQLFSKAKTLANAVQLTSKSFMKLSNNKGFVDIGKNEKVINAAKKSIKKQQKLLKEVKELKDIKVNPGEEPWWSVVFRFFSAEKLPETYMKIPK